MAGLSARPRAAQMIAIAGVAILALGVVTLAGLALQQAKPSAPSQSPAPVPTFSLGVATPTPTLAPTPPPGPTFERHTERFLSSASGTLWRATAGSCGGPAPLVERSNDGGDTWTDVTPLYAGISQFASLDGLAVDAVEAVAAMGPACETHAVRSFTNGRFWESFPGVLPGSRYIDLTDASLVHLSTGSVAAPCADARGLRAEGSVVSLICGDEAFVWADGTWSSVPTSGVTAIEVDGDNLVVAHAAESCPGLAVSRFLLSESVTPVPITCVEGIDPAQPAAVAVDLRGTVVWSGDSLTLVPEES